MANQLNLKFTTLILDLDGPILDGKHRHYECYSTILKEHGFPPIPLEQYWQMKRERLDRHQQLQQSHANEIYDIFLEKWLQRIETPEYLKLDILQPHVLSILTSWKNTGIKLVLATMRNHPENLFKQLEELTLYHFFDEIIPVGNLQGNFSKSAAVKNILNESLENCLWIGDTEIDIQSARELGITVAAVTNGLRTAEYLQTLKPDYLYSDLQELSLRGAQRRGNPASNVAVFLSEDNKR